VFGTWGAWRAPMIAGGSDAAMRSLSDTMMAMWIAFARTGDPSLPGLPWPVYDPARRSTMVFGDVVQTLGDPAGLESDTLAAVRQRTR
ncbi:MAG: carboxylesterase family protein, partial [Acidisphaera sp.]|nr:carboxylesterase family protein [Acidisphaera sp.]